MAGAIATRRTAAGVQRQCPAPSVDHHVIFFTRSFLAMARRASRQVEHTL